MASFKLGMQRVGRAEGRDYEIFVRFADFQYDRFPALIDELLADKGRHHYYPWSFDPSGATSSEVRARRIWLFRRSRCGRHCSISVAPRRKRYGRIGHGFGTGRQEVELAG
jgi:hypothetical protein